jgi:hypothetical protein
MKFQHRVVDTFCHETPAPEFLVLSKNIYQPNAKAESLGASRHLVNKPLLGSYIQNRAYKDVQDFFAKYADDGEGGAPPMLAKGSVKGHGETNNKGSAVHNLWTNSKGPLIINNCRNNSKGGATQNIPFSILPNDDSWKMFHTGAMTNHAEDLALAWKHGWDAAIKATGDGFSRGVEKGWGKGRVEGRAEGRAEAYDEGKDKGYSEGFEDGLDVGARSCNWSIEQGCTTATIDGEGDAD